MSDNVYRVLMGSRAPFLGLANEKYTEYLRRGIIIDTHYDMVQENAQNTYTYNTVDITWLDGQPFTSINVPLSYPFISNEGWGLQIKPEKGDTVIAAFLPNTQPQILRFIKRSEFLQLGQIDVSKSAQILDQYGDPIPMEGKGAYKPFREIVAGEYSLKSKKGAEIYADDNGSFKIITRTQEENSVRNQEISYGTKIINEVTNEPETDFKGNNVNYEHKDIQSGYSKIIGSDGSFVIKNNGWTIVCDSENKFTMTNESGDNLTIDNGTINFKNKQGDSIEISGGKIKVGTNAIQPMALGDSLLNFINTIIGIYNIHTHSIAEGVTLIPNELMTPATDTDFLSQKTLVE